MRERRNYPDDLSKHGVPRLGFVPFPPRSTHEVSTEVVCDATRSLYRVASTTPLTLSHCALFFTHIVQSIMRRTPINLWRVHTLYERSFANHLYKILYRLDYASRPTVTRSVAFGTCVQQNVMFVCSVALRAVVGGAVGCAGNAIRLFIVL